MNHLRIALLSLPFATLAVPAAAQDPAPADGDPTAPGDALAEDAGADEAAAEESAFAEPAAEPSPTTYEALEADVPDDAEMEEASDGDEPNVFLGIKVGVLAPQIVNELGLHALTAIDVGYFLPFAERRIALQFEATFAPPGVDGNHPDPRIGSGGGTVQWSQRTFETSFGLGATVRFLPPTRSFSPYVTVLGRLYLLKTHTNGSANGQTFAANDEVSTQGGVTGALGMDLELGPGRLLVEIGSGWSPLPHVVTGDTSTTNLNLLVGYRFTF